MATKPKQEPTNDQKPSNDPTSQPAAGPIVAPATPVAQTPPTTPPVTPPAVQTPPATAPAVRKPALVAVDYIVIACIGCNSTNTVRIERERKLTYHLRKCRSCGKEFKEPGQA